MHKVVRLAALLIVCGCDRGSATRDGAADSTTVAPAPAPSPEPAVPAVAQDSSSKQTGSKVAPKAPPIGYDSAFGPTFTVDSTGKVTRIPKKKP